MEEEKTWWPREKVLLPSVCHLTHFNVHLLIGNAFFSIKCFAIGCIVTRQDTKHVLQLIDEMNKPIENGEVSLDGVALVTLDVEAMYNNMTDELAGGASK